jgi:hypothetical protein
MRKKEAQKNNDSIFTLFALVGGLLWMYAKRVFNLNTLASLEKKQGPGGGTRDIEDELLDRALECNPHQYHLEPDEIKDRGLDTVLIVKSTDEDKSQGGQA